MWVDTLKKTDQFFWHELVFIGGREGHYFHFLGPTKSLHSHLPVRLLHLNSFLACYVQNIQKILLQHFFHSIYQLPRNYRTKGNDNLLQKYFLDVLYIAIVLIDIDFNSFVLIKSRRCIISLVIFCQVSHNINTLLDFLYIWTFDNVNLVLFYNKHCQFSSAY